MAEIVAARNNAEKETNPNSDRARIKEYR
jgi:hypothetical protein